MAITLAILSNIANLTSIDQHNDTSSILIQRLNLNEKANLSLLEEENENSSDVNTVDEYLIINLS